MIYYGSIQCENEDPLVIRGAQSNHALKVLDAILDCIAQVEPLSFRVTNRNAQAYLRFGAGRGLNMIWHAYRDIILTAPPNKMTRYRLTRPVTSTGV